MAITRGTEIGQKRETPLDWIWPMVCLAFTFLAMEAGFVGYAVQSRRGFTILLLSWIQLLGHLQTRPLMVLLNMIILMTLLMLQTSMLLLPPLDLPPCALFLCLFVSVCQLSWIFNRPFTRINMGCKIFWDTSSSYLARHSGITSTVCYWILISQC